MMDVASALSHLHERLREAEAAPSKNRPHWSVADMEAIGAIVDRPAAAEQIALARIEGLTTYHDYSQDSRLRIHKISRRALGLPI